MAETILCLASYFKGDRFLEECKRLGCHVILITQEELQDEAWPRSAIDEFFAIPDLAKQPDITYAVAYLARDRVIDRIVPLDDYDVETAAALREHMRLSGMGSSTVRFFRDKLAMRVQAAKHDIRVPAFVHVLNHGRIHAFTERIAPPWVLKPRSEAGSMGLRKVESADQLWSLIEELGDRQSYYVLEQFVPGDVFHVDSIVDAGNIIFAQSHKYGLPPMTVYQGGGVFVSSTLSYGGAEDTALQAINRDVIRALGMSRGVTHAEFIRSHAGGDYNFLEIAARVGGAGVDRLVEAATDVNPWTEWARLIVAELRNEPYALPATTQAYAGLMVSLARQAQPDTSAYNDPEIIWRMEKEHHVGLLVQAPEYDRIQNLIAGYGARIVNDFTAVEAPLDRPPF